MNILQHLDKENLHHAYLIEGVRDEIVPEIIELSKLMGLSTVGNPDFCHITIDNFKIDEAFSLRAMSSDKSFSVTKKVFLICINTITLDAQNVLLKMFEEPIENTHFFLVIPDTGVLLKTLISRFYFISPKPGLGENVKEIEKFISMSLRERIDFIKELLNDPEEKDEEGNKIMILDSARSKSLKFLNTLEAVVYNKLLKNSEWYKSHIACLEHFFKVREFLRMPGSSTKTLMESVALITPIF